jgi:Domain of unknown function (DUF4148)
MKVLIYAALAAGVLAGPTISFAQETTAPVTRAQVRAELVRLESVGYRPGVKNVHYPDDLEAAQARLRAQDNAAKSQMPAGQ